MNETIQIEFTLEFKRNLRHLLKKYPHLREDIQPVLDQLQQGQTVGVQIPGTSYAVFKVRLPNRDVQKGKRSGYRLIYYLKTQNHFILITIYSKSEQGNISADQIRRILLEFNTQSS